MAMQAHNPVKALADAVATAFSLADMAQAARAPGQIEMMNLPWVTPPLITPYRIGKVELQGYFDFPLQIDADDLYDFWQKTLQDLWHKPGTIGSGRSYTATHKLMKRARPGYRQFRFTLPAGWPRNVDERAGVILSLEAAHAAFTGLPVRDQVVSLSDYYVELLDGRLIGVKDGKPLIDSPWEYDASGEVYDLLESDRGDPLPLGLYDQISAMRSVLHLNARAFRKEFEAVDQALQALRVMSLGSGCPSLVNAMVAAPISTAVWVERERALYDCFDVIQATLPSDRRKLETMKTLLVPAVFSQNKFRRLVWYCDDFPFVLPKGRMDSIYENLRTVYETEVPAQLRRVIP